MGAVRPVDHYEHWQRAGRSSRLLDRERAHLRFLRRAEPGSGAILDAGCGGGDFLEVLRRAFPQAELAGADYSPDQVAAAARRGFPVERANFEERVPYETGRFAAVNAAQVIEHLYNPDGFVRELHRVLEPGGRLVLSTPNLCAWYNRALVLAGVQPIFYETSTESTAVGAGVLGRFKQGEQPVGHVRLFTLRALRDLLGRHGFEVLETAGALFDEGLPEALLPLDRAFTVRPSFSSLLVVHARSRG